MLLVAEQERLESAQALLKSASFRGSIDEHGAMSFDPEKVILGNTTSFLCAQTAKSK